MQGHSLYACDTRSYYDPTLNDINYIRRLVSYIYDRKFKIKRQNNYEIVPHFYEDRGTHICLRTRLYVYIYIYLFILFIK